MNQFSIGFWQLIVSGVVCGELLPRPGLNPEIDKKERMVMVTDNELNGRDKGRTVKAKTCCTYSKKGFWLGVRDFTLQEGGDISKKKLHLSSWLYSNSNSRIHVGRIK